MRSKYEDEENEESESPGFAKGLFIGAALGAFAALLFAPKSGKETRQQLKDLADQQRESLQNGWEETKEKAGDIVSGARDKVDSVARQASGSVDHYAERAVDKVIQLAEDAKSTVDVFKKTE